MEPLTAIALFAAGVLIGGAIAYYFCQNSNPVPEGEMRNRLITNSEALRVINNKMNDNSNDSYSGHIPMNVLLPYIKFLERESITAVEQVAGVEFYFTRSDATSNGLGELSFLLYPTFLSENGDYIPYDPIASKTNLVKLIDLKATIPIGNGDASTRSAVTNEDNLVALNRANMSPPRQHTW